MRSFLASTAIAASTLFSSVFADYPGRSSGQTLAVYWGQGSGQKTLGSFCADSTIDIIPLAFVNVFPDQNGTYGYPGTNFGNACGGYYVNSNNQTTSLLASCPQIEADIKYCQSQGKKILLSLGGGSTGVFVASDDSAVKFANFLYGAFGPSSTSWTGPRPFGDACIDGFDFDIEANPNAIPVPQGSHYAAMVNQLRSLGKMMITAAPQCIVPDANMADALTNAYFDAVFVQFYNTPQCSARAFFDHTYGAYGGPATDISYDSWISWMQANSKNPNAPVYIGLPASPDATFGQMYLNTTEAAQLLSYYQSKYPAQFGGAMVWEATFSDNNQVNGVSYAANIKCALTGGKCGPSSSPTTSVPTATPTNTYTGSPITSPTYTGLPTTSPTYTGIPTTSPTYTGLPVTSGSYTPIGTSSLVNTVSCVTTTDRNGNTFTYTPTNIQPSGTSFSTGPYVGSPSSGPTTTSSPAGPITTTDRNGYTFTYTPTQEPTTPAYTASVVTATDRNGNSYTYTLTTVQPTGVSTATGPGWKPSTSAAPVSPLTTSTTDGWGEWDPSTDAYPASTSSSTSAWGEWDPATTTTSASAVWTPDPTDSGSWGEWDPSSSTTTVAAGSLSSLGWTWHFSTSSSSSIVKPTHTQSWVATITASDARTVTIMPLPASTGEAHASIASWSSFWTDRASFSTQAAWSSTADVAAATETSTSSWRFTGWSAMPSYTTLAPLPSIVTVTPAAAGATTSASPSVGVYVQPNPVGSFQGAGAVSRPVFATIGAVFLGVLAVLF